MRLFVVADYRARDVFHPKGTVLDVPASVANFYLMDAPGCFSLTDPSVSTETLKSVDSAPADKMLRRGKTK
jgi:hypothetical protein